MLRRKNSLLLAGLLAVGVPANLFAQHGGGGHSHSGHSGGAGAWQGGQSHANHYHGSGGNWNNNNWNHANHNHWGSGGTWAGGSWSGSPYRYGWGYPYRYGWGNGVSVGLWLGGGSPYYYGSSGAYYANPGVYYNSPGNPIGTQAYYSSLYQPPQQGQQPIAPPVDPTAVQLTVVVPSGDAVVWLNDAEMQTRGNVREYISPGLTSGKNYHYVVRAQWNDGGRVIDQTRKVPVTAGQRVVVDFSTPEVAPPKELPAAPPAPPAPMPPMPMPPGPQTTSEKPAGGEPPAAQNAPAKDAPKKDDPQDQPF